MSEWISVDDRLPKENGTYKVKAWVGSIAPKTLEHHRYFHKGRFSKGDWNIVTHWQPLPEPPK